MKDHPFKINDMVIAIKNDPFASLNHHDQEYKEGDVMKIIGIHYRNGKYMVTLSKNNKKIVSEHLASDFQLYGASDYHI